MVSNKLTDMPDEQRCIQLLGPFLGKMNQPREPPGQTKMIVEKDVDAHG